MLFSLGTIHSWLRPLFDALFTARLPWKYRWRLLVLQPLTLLTYSIASTKYLISAPFEEDWIPVAPGRLVRVLVFRPPSRLANETTLRPLHLDCHGGSFIGGLPESDATFCDLLARKTGAVVISTTYRYAPKHPFPAGIDDVEAVVAFLQAHAATRYGADPSMMSISGFSAGGNLALASSLSIPGRVKAAVIFYGAIDLRLPPWEKPKPANFPKTDPLSFLLPFFDSYAEFARPKNMENPRLNPIVATIECFPENILMIIPGIDILVNEQTRFIQRLKDEAVGDSKNAHRRFEILFEAEGFHGYLELPSPIIPKEKKDRAFEAGVKFILDAYERHGWQWKP